MQVKSYDLDYLDYYCSMILVSWRAGEIIGCVGRKLERKMSSTFLTVSEKERHPSLVLAANKHHTRSGSSIVQLYDRFVE